MWYKTQSGTGNMTGLSSAEWNAEYYKRYAENPPYQGASAYAAPLVLIDAIEKAGSLDSTVVMSELRKSTFKSSTFYGDVEL